MTIGIICRGQRTYAQCKAIVTLAATGRVNLRHGPLWGFPEQYRGSFYRK